MKRRSFLRWQNFKRKALTLSYDDGSKYDVRLMEIMDKHGLKGTFNLNSGFFAEKEGENTFTKETAYKLYANSPHEVAVHGVNHLSLAEVDEGMAVDDVINDRKTLEKLFGRVVKGMAYAYGSYSDEVVKILEKCGISYARTVDSTESFEVPVDWLRMPVTCHHKNPRLMELAKKFAETPNEGYFFGDAPMLFYLWGHSYEFNNDDNWQVIKEFAKYVGNRDDIWYATNGEIYDYVQAYDRLQFSADGTLVRNPSALDVYIYYFKKNYLVPAGKTVVLDRT